MRKVLMTRTEKGSQDGLTLSEFIKGRKYSITDDLAKAFVEDLRWAKFVDDGPGDPAKTSVVYNEGVPEDKTTIVAREGFSLEQPGIKPDKNTADAPEEKAVVDEAKIDTGTDPPEETAAVDNEISSDLYSSDGSPYSNARTARSAIKRRGMADTHEPAKVEGGYVLRSKKRAATRRTRGGE